MPDGDDVGAEVASVVEAAALVLMESVVETVALSVLESVPELVGLAVLEADAEELLMGHEDPSRFELPVQGTQSSWVISWACVQT